MNTVQTGSAAAEAMAERPTGPAREVAHAVAPAPAAQTGQTPEPGAGLVRMGLAACVLVSGGAIMVLEFLAVRVLQRYFGSAIEVWAAVIAVCLAALAIGYSIGGILADRFRSFFVLGCAYVLAGLTTALVEPLASAAGDALLAVDWGLDWHPYAAALVSTFLPLMVLGTILPQVVRLHVRDFAKVGASVGWITAVSTIGGILGVMLVVQVMLRYWGVRENLFGLAAVLAVSGAAIWLFSLRRGAPAAAAIAITALLTSAPADAQILFERYSSYHHIIVEDTGASRILRFNNDVQSTMSRADPNAGGFEYTDFFHVPMIFDPTLSRVLFVGLGGGTGPKAFLQRYPGVQVDVVEIDPVVVDVAREYFQLPEHPRLDITVMDGRNYLRRTDRRYGAILIDAYGSNEYGAYLPYHLATREFFEIVRERLRHGGTVVYNVVGAYGRMNDFEVRGIHATLEQVFDAVYAFGARTSVNTVFVAVKLDPDAPAAEPWPVGPWTKHPLDATGLRRLAMDALKEELVHDYSLAARVTQFSPAQFAPRTGTILTDNYAPVDMGGRRR